MSQLNSSSSSSAQEHASSLLHGTEPISINIGLKRMMRVHTTSDLEYVALDYSPTTSDYYEKLKLKTVPLPAPASIYFDPKQTLKILKYREEISAVSQQLVCGKTVDYKLDLGGNVFFTASSRYYSFQFRRFYKPSPESELYPTRSGVVMKEQELHSFLGVLPIIGRNIRNKDGGDALVAECEKLIQDEEEEVKGKEEEKEEVEDKRSSMENEQVPAGGKRKSCYNLPKVMIPDSVAALSSTSTPPTPSCEKANHKPSFKRKDEEEEEEEEVVAPKHVLGQYKIEGRKGFRKRTLVLMNDAELKAVARKKASEEEGESTEKKEGEEKAKARVIVLSDEELDMNDSQYPEDFSQ